MNLVLFFCFHLTVESRFQVVPMVRVATRLGCATVVQTWERVRGLPAGRLPVHRQPIAKEQAQEKVQPELETPESYHILTFELSIWFRCLTIVHLNSETANIAQRRWSASHQCSESVTWCQISVQYMTIPLILV